MSPRSANIFGKVISTILMALFLLASNANWMLLAAGAGDGCGTKCCRVKKVCCCRKKPYPQSQDGAISAKTCPPNCAQAPALPNLQLTLAANSTLNLFTTLVIGIKLTSPLHIACALVLCFALFQRPPPFDTARFA